MASWHCGVCGQAVPTWKKLGHEEMHAQENAGKTVRIRPEVVHSYDPTQMVVLSLRERAGRAFFRAWDYLRGRG